MDSFSSDDEIIVVGNFNLPDVEWLNDDPTVYDVCNVSSDMESAIINGLPGLGFSQFCDLKNNYHRF